MAALVDTSVLVDHLRGRAEARALLDVELAAGEPVFGSVLTRVEVMAGAFPREERATGRLLSALVWVEVSNAIADRAGELARKYLRSHPGVGVVDYVIAATRETLEVPLWTRNVKRFPMVGGLRAPY